MTYFIALGWKPLHLTLQGGGEENSVIKKNTSTLKKKSVYPNGSFYLMKKGQILHSSSVLARHHYVQTE